MPTSRRNQCLIWTFFGGSKPPPYSVRNFPRCILYHSGDHAGLPLRYADKILYFYGQPQGLSLQHRRKNAFSVGNAVLSVPRNPVLIVVILGRCGHRPLRIIPKAHGSISLLWQRRWILRSKRRRIGNKKQSFFRRLVGKPPYSDL